VIAVVAANPAMPFANASSRLPCLQGWALGGYEGVNCRTRGWLLGGGRRAIHRGGRRVPQLTKDWGIVVENLWCGCHTRQKRCPGQNRRPIPDIG
jgi:hypothetical protein